ncbi:ABC transporter permease [Clostridium felsineum]|uniref:Uncharacterized protein n=1 Tax=Clostridium felsineum TaxID=36839 RepID=A0A1S8LSC3_9CLOT|nr:ABC transporter permease [Clostridium felsineum]URZ04784.1 hypothetical protein CLROS_000990 [Clostridium felsineum]URZ09825.1 hypothetical protein CROST_005240 [Clostridium felsineum]
MLIFICILPLIFSGVFINISTSKIKVGFLDNDNTKLTKILKNELRNNYDLVDISSGDPKYQIENNTVNNVIEIEKGFTDSMFKDKTVNLKLYGEEKNDYYKLINNEIALFIKSVRKVYDSSNKNKEAFYKTIDKNGVNKINVSSIGINIKERSKIGVVFYFLIMFLLLSSCIFAKRLLNDDKRIFAAPIDIKSYVFEKLFILVSINIIQVIVVFLESIILFKSTVFNYIVSLSVLFLVVSVMSASFAMFVNKLSDRSFDVYFVVVPMCMLGGCFWGIESMPKELQFVSQFVPTRWIVEGIDNILFYNSGRELGIDILIIMLFTTVFILVGTITKKDIIK